MDGTGNKTMWVLLALGGAAAWWFLSKKKGMPANGLPPAQGSQAIPGMPAPGGMVEGVGPQQVAAQSFEGQVSGGGLIQDAYAPPGSVQGQQMSGNRPPPGNTDSRNWQFERGARSPIGAYENLGDLMG